MPKIRGVKPDYWTDEDIVELSIAARLVFIGMWNYACDNGHLQDKPKQIKMRLLPGDDENVAELLRELTTSGRIERSDGWITIPKFTQHQKPDKRYFLTCDKPGCGRPADDSQPETRSGHTGRTPGAHRDPKVSTVGPLVDGDGDGDGDGDKAAASTRRAPTEPDRFDEFWNHYPRRVSKGHARRAWKAAAKKADPDRIIAAATSYAEACNGTEPRFVAHPATWLNGERWADENAAPKPVNSGPVDVLASPPPGLSVAEYAAWEDEQRRKEAGR